jgi:hypothetical protein
LQSLHDVAPESEYLPAAHRAAAGVADVEPAGHAYPALQLLHAVAPATLNVPAAHIAADGVADVEPAGHA